MILYCISGLGADERVFSRLSLQAEIRHIRWVKPYKNEPLTSYAQRLTGQIDTSQPFALLGVSFGGVVAREMAQCVSASHLILVSSLSDTKQLPALARTAPVKHLLGVLPERLLFPPRWLMTWLFGVLESDDRRLLYQILENTDPHFLRWALSILLSIKKLPEVPVSLLVHGTHDRLLPFPKNNPQLVRIEGEGHFVVYTRADELSVLINLALAPE